jgi:hypothetical protein
MARRAVGHSDRSGWGPGSVVQQPTPSGDTGRNTLCWNLHLAAHPPALMEMSRIPALLDLREFCCAPRSCDLVGPGARTGTLVTLREIREQKPRARRCEPHKHRAAQAPLQQSGSITGSEGTHAPVFASPGTPPPATGRALCAWCELALAGGACRHQRTLDIWR